MFDGYGVSSDTTGLPTMKLKVIGIYPSGRYMIYK